jgi:hypothetical protein
MLMPVSCRCRARHRHRGRSSVTLRAGNTAQHCTTLTLFVQENLAEKNITLIFNLKSSMIRRIARCIGAEILHSIDVRSRCDDSLSIASVTSLLSGDDGSHARHL